MKIIIMLVLMSLLFGFFTQVGRKTADWCLSNKPIIITVCAYIWQKLKKLWHFVWPKIKQAWLKISKKG